MNGFETIIFESKGHAAWVTMNRPDVMNAQSSKMRKELQQALEAIRDDDDIWVVIITGAGDKAFSSGADISEFSTRSPSDLIKRRAMQTHWELIRQLPKPVIAMVNGLAMGGGCEIALACDIVFASDTAQFSQPETKVGIIPGAGGTQMLPRIVGEKRAKEMLFTGRPITAQEALQFGLVNRLVPRAELRKAVEDFVTVLLKRSPVALRLAKMAVNASLETSLSAGLSYEKDLVSIAVTTEDQKEAAKAFMEKRDPIYKGR